MNFENECGLFPDRARVICECRFVGGADFAQFRAARFQDFADAKAAADLDQLAARDDDFMFGADSAAPSNEMMDDQNERSRAIVHDGGCFRLTEEGEGAFEVSAAVTTVAGGKVEL